VANKRIVGPLESQGGQCATSCGCVHPKLETETRDSRIEANSSCANVAACGKRCGIEMEAEMRLSMTIHINNCHDG
jgi:hypothetical protein